MKTTSTASVESFEYAKAEIAREILKLKNRLDVISRLSNAITENSSLNSINYLLWFAKQIPSIVASTSEQLYTVIDSLLPDEI